MPTHIRAMVQWNVDSMLPRDVMQITPCFRHQQILPVDGGPEWQDLSDDLADAVVSWMGNPTAHTTTVKLYQIGLTPPNRPKATTVRNPGQFGAVNMFREISLCLSFNGGQNAPRQRGRLYLPCKIVDSTMALGTRPSATNRELAGNLAPLLAGLGGIDVDWIVWSPTNESATKVERWFVDDEWDIQRRRGLQPAARTAGTTGG